MKKKTQKSGKSILYTKFSQFIYLTVSNYNSNNLWESAASCSFGFVFSFIPILLIILTILVSILKVSPSFLNYVLEFGAELNSFFDIDSILTEVLKLQSVTWVQIFLGIWVIWMARKLFNSIVQGMNRIFRASSERKTLFYQLMTFVTEFVLVIGFIVITLAAFILNKFIHQPVFEPFIQSFPKIFNQGSNVLVTVVMYALLFLCTFYIYKFVSGTKPKATVCFFYALLQIASFFVLSFFLNKTINIANYNFLYGTISTLIIVMVKVYFFFALFLFFAQMVYVSQFLKDMLLAEFYLLPDYSTEDWGDIVRRVLFINSSVLQTSNNTVEFLAGDMIFTQGDPSDSVYYIHKGSVCQSTENSILHYNQGDFFGDVSCILNQKRFGTAVAETSCKLLKLSSVDFFNLLKSNPEASSKAISKVSSYTARLYGNRNDNLI